MVDNRKIQSYDFSRQELEVDNNMPPSFAEDYLGLWELVRGMNSQLNNNEGRVLALEEDEPVVPPEFRELLLAHDPIIYYGFDQSSYTFGGSVENLGSGSDGLVDFRLPSSTDGVINAAANMDGTAIRSEDPVLLSGGKTVGFFVRSPPESSIDRVYLYSMNNQFDVILNFAGDNLLSVFRASTPRIETSSVTAEFPYDNNWYFFVIVHNQDSVVIYRNGASVSSFAIAPFTASNSVSYFGRATGNDRPYFGDMDEAFLLNKALTSAEVLELYESSGLT